jgi:hypothetical protein
MGLFNFSIFFPRCFYSSNKILLFDNGTWISGCLGISFDLCLYFIITLFRIMSCLLDISYDSRRLGRLPPLTGSIYLPHPNSTIDSDGIHWAPCFSHGKT